MFRVSQHPSSGVPKTVTATSGVGHNHGTATSFQRTAKSLYMFRVSQHPSSGVPNTVTATSGVGHNPGTATSFQCTAKSLYMFRVSPHPSSGVPKTVTATSGVGHNHGTATSFQRGLIGTAVDSMQAFIYYKVTLHFHLLRTNSRTIYTFTLTLKHHKNVKMFHKVSICK
jgi:hypothetical protein